MLPNLAKRSLIIQFIQVPYSRTLVLYRAPTRKIHVQSHMDSPGSFWGKSTCQMDRAVKDLHRTLRA